MLYLPQDVVGTIVADLEEGRPSSRELHAPVINDPRLARLFMASRRAALHPQGEPAFEERRLALFGGLFGMEQRPGREPDGRLSQVRERIEDDPICAHSLTDLAALAGLSRYQTLRGFACLAGWSA